MSDFLPIENYGVIGNLRTLALVSMTGAIDFFCFPRFDSPTVFAALLDPQKGGYFCIQANLKDSGTKQLYLPDTNVLLTRFLSGAGIAEITDFMPVLNGDDVGRIVRRVAVIHGDVEFNLQCRPRFDYGRVPHTAKHDGNAVLFLHDDDQPPFVLQSTLKLQLDGDDVAQSFRLKAGDVAWFVFSEDAADARKDLSPEGLEEEFQKTSDYWRNWIGQSNYKGRWREMVNRSGLLLKLLIDRDYGSIVAAPTFALPESIGGSRNWDYRYTWLRDSSFVLYAMMRLGFQEEAAQFQRWIHDRLNYDSPQGPLQVLYRIDGTHETPETTLDNLRGYEDSRPVRIGNAAWQQLQLDIYGEFLDSVYLAAKYGDGLSIEDWENVKRMLRWLASNWNQPDDGIWEVRGGRKHFLHSRLMCWVAFDRAVRLGAKRSLTGPFGWMEETRDEIANDIHTNFWDEELQSFVQYKGAKVVDAAILLMPMMRFISPTDPKWLSTLKRIDQELTVDTFVYRYKYVEGFDGLKGDEGSFTACCFWFIEALARSHETARAQLLFEKMLGYANHLGLYSEELGSSAQHLGNFPQALTHLALISAATYLDRDLSGTGPKEWK
ncbi:glycoside hydrolase family 15 protein [Edaphobacter sp. 12200R-103]|jgi:GH15 family glucan-1,4-alpha-glucosidase|uniref:glycoside hydrolase family 15 protein n=1 Tax=Edaphobacter sp. 12200R-103 TaxID=2703788 RepID=UPI00138D21C1|nr:glycoside hydrolase family 15 protein [Edaphobacter sp. 12200R-103]QHS51106.1 glycoside hydrolase family 15 protein [Edaphobacter sp. 12200R-103]